jgi:gamma-glutamyltranspeptidase/glutathione hydrolase
MNIQEAIDMPHITNMNGITSLEAGTEIERYQAALSARGHAVEVRDLNSGLHGITVRRTAPELRLEGGADPRREGAAKGDLH